MAGGADGAADMRAVVANVIDLEQIGLADRAGIGVEAGGSAWTGAVVAQCGEHAMFVEAATRPVVLVGAGGGAAATEGWVGGRGGAGVSADGAGLEAATGAAMLAVGAACGRFLAGAGGAEVPEAEGVMGPSGADAAAGAEGARGAEEIALPPASDRHEPRRRPVRVRGRVRNVPISHGEPRRGTRGAGLDPQGSPSRNALLSHGEPRRATRGVSSRGRVRFGGGSRGRRDRCRGGRPIWGSVRGVRCRVRRHLRGA